jgi:hypothetical protein
VTPLPLGPEIRRVFDVVEPRGEREHRIHFAGDVADVVRNIWRWNDEIAEPRWREAWGKRRTQFFVASARGEKRREIQFAPAKFSAFIPSMKLGGAPPPSGMTIEVYLTLGEEDPRFDGHRARTHLAKRLVFEAVPLAESAAAVAFGRWLAAQREPIELREPVTILFPPSWF